jgi:hypothetical protein
MRQILFRKDPPHCFTRIYLIASNYKPTQSRFKKIKQVNWILMQQYYYSLTQGYMKEEIYLEKSEKKASFILLGSFDPISRALLW